MFGLCGWLLVNLYTDLKEDVKEIKTSNQNIRTDVAKLAVQQANTDAKVTAVCNNIEKVRTQLSDVDKRTHGLADVSSTIVRLEGRANDTDRKYGQILMILDGMAKRVGIDFRKAGK